MMKESKFRKYRWLVMGLLAVVTVFLGIQLKNTKLDSSVEKMFPKNDAETKYFHEFRAKFNSENDYLLLIIERKAGIFDSTFLSGVGAYSQKLSKLKNVSNVTSITNQKELLLYSGGIKKQIPYIDLKAFDPKRDSTRIYSKEELVKNLVSKDGKSLCLFIKHDDYLSNEDAEILITSIKNTSKKYKFDNLVVFGRSYAQNYVMGLMSFQMALFLILSAILIIVCLFLAFRSIWGILIPQLVVFLGMFWLLGGMGLFNSPINILLTVMPSIMFVVSMSDVIHLVSRYLDALRTEDTNFDAIMLAIKEVGLATLLTSLTTAIGFMSLYFIPIEPLQKFGIIMGIGVLIAFVLTFTILPILFYTFPGPKRVQGKKGPSKWDRRLKRLFILVVRNPKRILIAAIGVLLLSGLGITMVVSNNYMMDDLPEDDPLIQDVGYISDHYGGTRPFTMTVELTDTSKSIWNLEVLQEIDTVQTYLETRYDVQVRSSLITALKVMNRGKHSGDANYYALPESQKRLNSFKKALKISNEGKMIRMFMDSTQTTLQINGFLDDVGNIKITKRNKELEKFLTTRDFKGVEYHLTGTSHLVDKNMRSLVQNMLMGLGISILVIALLLGLIFKSFRVVLISLVPNLLPLIVLTGLMGFLGINIKLSTAIIFSIAFGIVVDDTIHLLGKFRHELSKGKSVIYALQRAYITTGKAMILTTLILCAGFFLMVFSCFMGTFYLGFLLTVVLVVALIADLTVLPVLLLLFYKKKSTASK
ncbi:MAG: putative RND superfamily exporter protein [Crocinitomicaceae bacterium]|jgi:predicted RND superfamily exporter protein